MSQESGNYFKYKYIYIHDYNIYFDLKFNHKTLYILNINNNNNNKKELIIIIKPKTRYYISHAR